jgi:hypothetical protein
MCASKPAAINDVIRKRILDGTNNLHFVPKMSPCLKCRQSLIDYVAVNDRIAKVCKYCTIDCVTEGSCNRFKSDIHSEKYANRREQRVSGVLKLAILWVRTVKNINKTTIIRDFSFPQKQRCTRPNITTRNTIAVFLRPSRQNLNRPRPISSTSFPIYNSAVTLSFDAIWPKLLKNIVK